MGLGLSFQIISSFLFCGIMSFIGHSELVCVSLFGLLGSGIMLLLEALDSLLQLSCEGVLGLFKLSFIPLLKSREFFLTEFAEL